MFSTSSQVEIQPMVKGKWVTIPSSSEIINEKNYEKGLKSKIKYVISLN